MLGEAVEAVDNNEQNEMPCEHVTQNRLTDAKMRCSVKVRFPNESREEQTRAEAAAVASKSVVNQETSHGVHFGSAPENHQ